MDKTTLSNDQTECVNSTQHSIYTRRCFITGELCSKQPNVHKEREALHRNKEINAFVIMNFSGMSDVVYKWKLQSFIESLKRFLYLDTDGVTDGQQIACVANAGEKPTAPSKVEWTQVQKINVIRADSDTASNYIICSRICQQIQVADIVIVDVSVENTNVFYEFGLAAAFGKLILPICYSESFYEMKIPQKAAELIEKKRQQYANEDNEDRRQKLKNEVEKLRGRIEHHIDCYPWRRKLFENYGIRYRNSKSQVCYGLFSDVTQEIYGFSDKRYGRFPYDIIIRDAGDPLIPIQQETTGDECRKVGFLIYDRLRASYHTKRSDQELINTNVEKYNNDWTKVTSSGNGENKTLDSPIMDPHNTLVVYTMDGILNEEQAGQCIINYYNNMTYQIQAEHCFCGDRVAILSQSNVISDDPKDTKVDKKLLYGVGDIIRIGMNQATYVAHQRRIKTDDYLLGDSGVQPYEPPSPESPKALIPNCAEYKKWDEALAKWMADREKWEENCADHSSTASTNLVSPEQTDQSHTELSAPESCPEKWKLYNELWERDHQKWEDNWRKKSDDTIRFVKEYIRNRCIPLLPDEPIYVKQYTEGIQQKLFHTSELDKRNCRKFDHSNFFTMFHMMLYTLRYANEVVVDISGNSLQALFWLGVAHGSDIPAITVRHALTEEERDRLEDTVVPKERRIFDVAGLWTATLNANDVDSFYDQLSLTQTGIEQHNRLILPKINAYRDEFMDFFYETWRINHLKQKRDFSNFICRKREEEGRKLESFYRNSFWRRLLRSNELDLYIARYDGTGEEDKQPRILDISWDVQATSELNQYLSKRTVIGRYTLREIEKETENNDSERVPTDGSSISAPMAECNNSDIHNFISIGGSSLPLPSGTRPTGRSLAQYIQDTSNCGSLIRKVYAPSSEDRDKYSRGFVTHDKRKGICAHFPSVNCINTDCPEDCSLINGKQEPAPSPREDTANQLYAYNGECAPVCEFCKDKRLHQQLAQMVLWREVTGDERSDVKFWISLIGVSGPATLALTSLLVDDKQKERLFTQKTEAFSKDDCKWCMTPLKDLQQGIRSEILKEYDCRLKRGMGITGDSSPDHNKLNQYELVSYTTQIYLSTILYQYFFPFLSKSDEKRIGNSMRAFLTAITAADGDTFKRLKEIDNLFEHVENALDDTIKSLRGVDALYTVTVQSGGRKDDEDDRWPVDIRCLDEEYQENSVICLFSNESSSRGEKSE